MSNYQFPESVLTAAFSTAFRYAASMPVEEPLTLTRKLLATLEPFIEHRTPGYSTGECIVAHICELNAARSQMLGDPEGCGPDPELDFEIKVCVAIHAAWCDWWAAENRLAMGQGPDDAWDRCDPMFRATQCYGKMEVEEDDTLALEDAADLADTPF